MTAVDTEVRATQRAATRQPLHGTRGWAVPVRLAWRDIRGHRTRSVLAMVMIGVPVLLAAGLATVLATTSLDGEDSATRYLGSAAAAVEPVVADEAERAEFREITGQAGAATRQELAVVFGNTSTVEVTEAYTRVVAPTRGRSTDVTVTDPASPLTDGLFDLVDGRLPRTPDEVAASPGLLERLGVGVGDSVTINEQPRVITGAATRRYDSRRTQWLLGVTGEPGLIDADDDLVGAPTRLLVGDPLTNDQREQLLDLRVDYRTSVDLAAEGGSDLSASSLVGGLDSVTTATVVTLVVIELTLLAGPAFAVGVRQQRRMLAQLAATGADARALRRTVIAQALLLGVLGSVLGAMLGILAGLAFMAAARDRWPSTMGPLDVTWPLVGYAIVIGVVAATLAAVQPAAVAGRTSAVGALGLTRGSTGYPWRRAVLGAAVFFAAIVLLVGATRSGGSRDVGLASVGVLGMTVGMLLMIPLVVALLLPAGRVMPPVWRLATRDAARAATRSVAAVAAVAAAAGGLVTVATFYGSYNAFERKFFVPDYETGRAIAAAQPYSESQLGVPGDGSLDEVSAAVAQALPGAPVQIVNIATPGDYLLSADPCQTGDVDCSVFLNEVAVTDGPVSSDGIAVRELSAFVADGGVVMSEAVIGPGAFDGPARLQATEYEDGALGAPVVLDVDVMVVSARLNTGTSAVMSTTTAERLLGSQPARLIVGDGELSNGDLDRLDAAVSEVGGYTISGRQYQDANSAVAIAVAVAALLALVGGTLTATALTLSDARRERAVLAAVGARPLTNRLTAGATAVVIAALGGLAGVALGLPPGILAARSQTDYAYDNLGGSSGVVDPTVALPWAVIGLVVVALPLALGLVVGLFARGPSALDGAR